MNTTVKKFLLSGTAIFAFYLGAQAQAAQTIYATTGTYTGTTGNTGTTGGIAGAGQDGGVYNNADPSITVTLMTNISQGGAGGSSTTAGGAGGNGGIGVNFNGDNGVNGNPTALIYDGNNAAGFGGAGAAGTAGTAGAGGNGGNGGVGVLDNANFTSITHTTNDDGDSLGGHGGIGGNGGGLNAAGGNGGNGGDGTIITGNNALLSVGFSSSGSFGGAGGIATGTAISGTGGNGGDGLTLSGSNVQINVGPGLFPGIFGGNGGAGGASSGSTGTAGDGGNGGNGILVSGAGNAITVASGAYVEGETAGAAGSNANGGTAGVAGFGGTGIIFGNNTTAASLTNHGTVGADIFSTGQGITLYGSAALTSLNNDGLIVSITGAGLGINNTATIGTFANTGTIKTGSTAGDTNAALVLNSTAQGALANAGTISNTGGGVALAITAVQAGTFTNAAGGHITSTTGSGGTLANHTAIDFANTGTVVNNGTITGNITNTGPTSGTTTATLTNTGTIAGNVTLGGGSFPTYQQVGILNLNAGTITGTVDIGGNGQLHLNGGQIIGNTTIDPFFIGFGMITVGGNYTTGGTISGSNASLAVNSGIFNAQNNVNLLGGALTNNSTVRVGAGSTLSAGTQSGTGNYVFDVASAASFGHLTITNTAVTLTNTNTSVHVLGAPVLSTGDLLQIASGTSAAIITAGTVMDNSATLSFDLEPGSAVVGGNVNDAYLIATSSLATNGTGADDNEANVGATLAAIGTSSSDPDFNAVQLSVQNAPTNSQANHDLKSLEPISDGGSVAAAIDATDMTFDLADQQLALLRLNDGTTGVSAGNRAGGLRFWGQVFGGHTSQEERSGDNGYNSNTVGGAVGADTQDLYDDSVLGLSFAYGHAHVASDDFDASTQVNSYQLTAYGNHYLTSIDKGLFLNGMAAFQYDRNHEGRRNLGGVDGLDANAGYNAYEGAGRAELGRDFGLGGFGGLTLTPTALADYTYYRSSSYDENGAGGANLHVGSNSENILNLGLGTQATWLFKNDDGSYFKPDIRAQYKYDVLHDDKASIDSSFAAGGPSFRTNGLNPSNHSLNAGFDARFYNTYGWELTGSYDFTYKPGGYHANDGVLRAAYKF